MTAEFTFKLETFERKMVQELKDALFDANELIAEFVKGKAIEKCPVGHGPQAGELRRSIDYENLSWEGFDFVAKEPYAIFVEMNTKPHEIKPKNGKALAWGKEIGTTKDGKIMRENVAKSVFHPGTQAQPFMLPAINENKDKIIKKYNEVIFSNLKQVK